MQKKFNKIEVATTSIAHMVHNIYSSFFAPILPLILLFIAAAMTFWGLGGILVVMPLGLIASLIP